MRVLFFSFYNKVDIEVHPGVGVLSTALKKHGHQTRLEPYFYFNENSIIKTVQEFRPDIIGISCTHMSVEQVKKLCPYLKQISNASILLGGIYPILDADDAIAIEGVDAICFGEGTQGMIEYVNGQHPATNYLYKDGRRGVYQCWSPNPLLDVDYELFWECSRRLNCKTTKKLDYWTSFTCEYGCSFCCNKKIRNVTGLKNKPRHEVECAINKMQYLIEAGGFKKVQFRDPLFLGVRDRFWIEQFLTKYKSEIGLPFSCNIRADRFDYEIAAQLKEAGCYLIKMGLESGSEYLRNKVLHKGESDDEFFKSRKITTDLDIKLSLNAMLGIPYETPQSAKQTVELMQELQPDKTFLHIYQPWPGLKLPAEINNYIIYKEYPAIDNAISVGRTAIGDQSLAGLDLDKLCAETILTPVLDQPQFPYEVAVQMQQEFFQGGESD